MTEEQALAHKVDRTGWPAGPWDGEPDRVDFEHAGFACLLLRGGQGVWCGYVGVGPDHACHGKAYDEVAVDVHGGLTYADKCYPPICHVAKPGMPDRVWWLGFDCNHSGDVSPREKLQRYLYTFTSGGVYRTVKYVRTQTERLAEQLAAVTA